MGPERGLEVPVEPLHYSVRLRVVGRRRRVLNAQESAEAGKDLPGKLGAPVGHNLGWRSKPGNPLFTECGGDSVGGDVGEFDGLQPARVTVDDGEEVAVAIHLLQGPHQVKMYDLKGGRIRRELSSGWPEMSRHFGLLTGLTLVHPVGDVAGETAPHIGPPDQTLGSLNTRVREAVHRIENSPPERHRHDDASSPAGHIGDETVWLALQLEGR